MQGHSFLAVLFLCYKTRYEVLGNFSKTMINFVTSSVGMIVLNNKALGAVGGCVIVWETCCAEAVQRLCKGYAKGAVY